MSTGLKANGEALQLPVGHTQYVWRVRGPLVDGEAAFFQGVGGTGFFPKLDQRPVWTGTAVVQKIRSGENVDNERIAKAADVAARYMRQILLESRTIAKGAPGEGYGLTGVCNNATACIQKAVFPDAELPLPWPLLRNPDLQHRQGAFNDAPAFADKELEKWFATLPFDDPSSHAPYRGHERVRIICRILKMIPLPLNSPELEREPFTKLRSQLRTLARQSGESCGPAAERRSRALSSTPQGHQ